MTDWTGEATTQIDGTRMAHYNCVAATARTITLAASLGYWNLWPAALRTEAGTPNYEGIAYPDIAEAVMNKTKGEVRLTVKYWVSDAFFEDLIDDGRFVAISIHTAETYGTQYATGTFRGRHNVGVVKKRIVRWTDQYGNPHSQKQGLVMDPGHSVAKFVWWPWSLILRAAHRSTGNGTIHTYYSADCKSVTRTTRSSGAIRSRAKDSIPNVVGHFKAGASITMTRPVRGEPWTIDGRTSRAWAKTPQGYIVGGKVKPH